MNSLEQLNSYSQSKIIFTDDRPFSITATTDGLPTTGVSIVEDTNVGFSAFGVTITNISSADDATADHITLTFDFSSATNPKVNWPTAPRAVEFSESTPGIFVASKIQLIEDYEFILNNTTVKLVDQVNFAYTVNASWPGTSYNQTFNALMTTTAETNLNGLTLQIRDHVGHPLFDLTQIDPSIIDTNDDSTYDLQLTSSLGATLSIGPGTPASSINITGDKTTVDGLLDTVYYYPIVTTSNQTDTINYTLTVTNGTLGNYVSESGSFTNFVPTGGIVLNNFNVSRTYTQNAISDLFPSSYPSITDANGLTYTLRLFVPRGLIRLDTDTAPYANSIDITGTPTAISNTLSSNTIEYIPVGGDVADVDVVYTLLHNGFTVIQDTFTTLRLGGTALPVRTITTNSFLTESITDAETYFYKCDFLLVGTGGAGGDGGVIGGQASAGGGGGGGNILYYEDCNLFYNRNNPSTIDVFTGGNPTLGTKAQDTVIRNGDDGVTIIAAATGGGYGGDDTLPGEDGGYGGGGGANGPTPAGSGTPGTVPGYLTAVGQSLNLFGDGEPGQSGGNNAGDGGGNTSIDIDITGTAIRYSQPGPSIGSTLYTTPGSGGAGEAKNTSGTVIQNKTNGQTGLVYIKFYT